MENKWFYCALNLVLFVTTSSFIFAANAVKPTYCGSKDTFPVKVDNVVISPNPVVSGKPATFEISAISEDDISGGILSIEVFYYGMHVHSESHDLCSKTSCPVKQGSFVLTNSQSLPGFTPPGSYKLKMKMMDTDNKLLTCIDINFNIVHSSMISEI
ncbi:hypothetical protein SUGI_0626510 [Cryptomeria japonica]|uniref:uncharacterized protein LOC131065864 n=1 Tax=Cryptomeria japonica TaxID=3369 RepID=UPI0024147B68|nr:uncharacterized protein LOC131065864 [Cryptomeria japonica]GLJ31244.1 hypothetical protein SUGI_0626510 [Cryptomeria japonica]